MVFAEVGVDGGGPRKPFQLFLVLLLLDLEFDLTRHMYSCNVTLQSVDFLLHKSNRKRMHVATFDLSVALATGRTADEVFFFVMRNNPSASNRASRGTLTSADLANSIHRVEASFSAGLLLSNSQTTLAPSITSELLPQNTIL